MPISAQVPTSATTSSVSPASTAGRLRPAHDSQGRASSSIAASASRSPKPIGAPDSDPDNPYHTFLFELNDGTRDRRRVAAATPRAGSIIRAAPNCESGRGRGSDASIIEARARSIAGEELVLRLQAERARPRQRQDAARLRNAVAARRVAAARCSRNKRARKYLGRCATRTRRRPPPRPQQGSRPGLTRVNASRRRRGDRQQQRARRAIERPRASV